MSNRIGGLLFLLMSIVILFAGCDRSEKDWESATSEDTISAYEQFLEVHPEGQYTEEARSRLESLKREEHLWQKAESQNTVFAIDKYLETYPQGKFVEKAHSKMKDYTVLNPGESVEIASISSQVGEGVVSFKQGTKPDTLIVAIDNTFILVGQDHCLPCAEIIEIGPGLEVPLFWFKDAKWFLTKVETIRGGFRNVYVSKNLVDGITLDDLVLKSSRIFGLEKRKDGIALIYEGWVIETSGSLGGPELIITGPDKGAKFRKQRNVLILESGKAFFFDPEDTQ